MRVDLQVQLAMHTWLQCTVVVWLMWMCESAVKRRGEQSLTHHVQVTCWESNTAVCKCGAACCSVSNGTHKMK